MNDKVLAKHYDKLTQRERAVLVMNAFGRRDDHECMRLLDTAPRVTLDAPDCGREWQRLAFTVECHAMTQVENAARLFFLVAVGNVAAKKYPDADDAIQVTAYNIITRADGWRAFCSEVGIDSVGALRSAGADATLLEISENVAREIAPHVEEIRQILQKTFEDPQPRTAEQITAEYRCFLRVTKEG